MTSELREKIGQIRRTQPFQTSEQAYAQMERARLASLNADWKSLYKLRPALNEVRPLNPASETE